MHSYVILLYTLENELWRYLLPAESTGRARSVIIQCCPEARGYVPVHLAKDDQMQAPVVQVGG